MSPRCSTTLRSTRRSSTARPTAPISPRVSVCATRIGCTRWFSTRRCCRPTTSTRCATPPGACCGTARIPRPRNWRPRCDSLVDDGVLTPAAGQLTAAVYGFAGPELLDRQLDLLLRGRRGLWTVLDQASRFLFDRKAPYRHEPDLVGRIGFRELNYGAAPDGMPLDPAVAFREFAQGTNGVRSRAVRSGRRDAEVQLADGGDLRRPRSDHPAARSPRRSCP